MNVELTACNFAYALAKIMTTVKSSWVVILSISHVHDLKSKKMKSGAATRANFSSAVFGRALSSAIHDEHADAWIDAAAPAVIPRIEIVHSK